MNHFTALLNVLEAVDFDKQMSKAFFENYLHEYLSLSHNQNSPISEQDFETMKEVAVACGLQPQEFETIVNEAEDDDKENDKEDKYDKQLNNVVEHPPGVYAFDDFLNRWYSDPDTEPTITTPGYAH